MQKLNDGAADVSEPLACDSTQQPDSTVAEEPTKSGCHQTLSSTIDPKQSSGWMLSEVDPKLQALCNKHLLKGIADNISEALTAVEPESTLTALETWLASWPVTPTSSSYQMRMFDEWAIMHYRLPADSEHDAPRRGVQALLLNELLEQRKNFRSNREARVWIKKQLKVTWWPASVPVFKADEDQTEGELEYTFNFNGPLCTNLLTKRADK